MSRAAAWGILILVSLSFYGLVFMLGRCSVEPEAIRNDSPVVALRIKADRAEHARDSIRVSEQAKAGARDSAWRRAVDSIRALSREALQRVAETSGRRARAEVLAKDSTVSVEAPGDSQCIVEVSCTTERWRAAADSLNRVRADSIEGARLVERAQCQSDLAKLRVDSAIVPEKPKLWKTATVFGGIGTVFGAILVWLL